MNPYFQQIRLKHGVQLELEIDDAIPEIAIDQAQMETLITQLVDNALVAVQTRKDTAKFIWIRTRADAEHIDLIIKDNGSGISNEEKERIWTPFYSSSPEHIGIGLTICEKIISNHDGTCKIYSEPGQYTEIEISLPIAPAKKVSPPSFLPAMTKKPASAALTVLIVDDEEYSRDLMKEILEKQDESLSVFTAGTSTDAVNLLQSREFALVIGDIRMPESNEEDWLAVLQAAEHRPRLLIVTTDPEEEDIAEFLRMNHIPCLKKPFAGREFISTIQEILY
jgi:CheY-like chemotaxis protein